MIAIKGKNEEEIGVLFNAFLEEYKDLYDEDALEYIKDNFWYYLYSPSAPDILMQVYGEIGVQSKKGNFYNAHLKKIKGLFGIDKNVLEVASGMIPTFAEKIACEQLKIKKGTITIYEPLLLKSDAKYPNMTLHKENFSLDTDIKNYDLVVGLLTCDATEAIIRNACVNDKDFYVAMCGCSHYINGYSLIMPAVGMYQNYVIEMARKLLEERGHELGITKLSSRYELDYPILYNKRK